MALSNSTKVVTPGGLVAVDCLGPNDEVYDKNGWLTKIVGIGPPKMLNTVTFVIDSGHLFTTSVDHPLILAPYGNAVVASNVGRHPQPSVPRVADSLVESLYWGSPESRRKKINESIEKAPWDDMDGHTGSIFDRDSYQVEAPELIYAINASGGIARSHAHPVKAQMIVTEDRTKVHKINRISVGVAQSCIPIYTESQSLLVTAGMIPLMSDRL